jgi:hypothetical protein
VAEEDALDVTRLREIAAQAVDPCVTNAAVVAAFWEDASGSAIDPQAGYDAVREQVQAVRDGGLSCVEAALTGQAIALNVIFAELARRGQAALNRKGDGAERYLRLAMRAQAQCRATLHELRDVSDRPTKEDEVVPPITRIERVIIEPPRRDAAGNIIPNEPGGEEDADGTTRFYGREIRYG